MPKVSQKQIKGEEHLVGRFWDDINVVSSAERMTYFEHLLTPTEVMMLAKRAAIFKDLINKRSYVEISGEYGVGVLATEPGGTQTLTEVPFTIG